MSEKKKIGKRKLPKKSKRRKRRYLLFELQAGKQLDAKQVFNAVIGSFKRLFGENAPKQHSLWFIEFNSEVSKGIVRCRLASVEQARKAIEEIKEVAGIAVRATTLKTSGTLRKLRQK